MLDWIDSGGVIAPFLDGVVSGTALTLAASACAFAIGLVLGIILLLARVSQFGPLRALVVLWVSLIRGTPALIHMLIAYYMVPALLDISISPVTAGIAALACNTSAYIVEILRGSLGTISWGQRAAGYAMGMRTAQVWRHVLLPQMIYRAIPPLTSEFTLLLKASSLMSIIAVPELATVARNATLQTDLPLQVFTITAAVYFLILFCISAVSRLCERRIARMLPHGH
ncbi:amino acid ABC transporter permease [Paraburkholderia silvatlantica]|uniref:Polar amino acid transport system permease protein n=1 Tax=Paraburkholderia silvatlantica TaxID=321895 RepID=A0ABR6FZT1_9BURK|nr:amino acid ABC transporter permease [Paraburkholderia silvatlantica]MBB2932950.1 polar amino acid transport system permease protein [Paraburkholderia silvatlantica]PVY16806.1 amino acid ABC transporter membrane protein 1 (PAAT family) [Paraburkholderia silvatlantica]PXW23497.1 amino acid ABC transporter membrane protein 1 (PAAT family) [Paraburkholderia silvatlantica]